MARRNPEPIRAVSCISLTPDGSVVAYLDDMTDEQRKYVGKKLAEKLLNSQFAGQVEFSSSNLPPPEELFPQLRK